MVVGMLMHWLLTINIIMKGKISTMPSPTKEQVKAIKPTKTSAKNGGLLAVKSANDWIDESIKMPDPKRYFHDLIVQYENTVIFAASNVGKSILAVQIAEDIAKTEKVIYADLELSSKQFQMRYSDASTGKTHVFPKNFQRAEIAPDMLVGVDLCNVILESIEETAKAGIKFFVIDNLTCICNEIERGKKAGEFMMRLIMLKKKYDLTTVVVAHTPKRRGWKPITQSDLAGSSKLINFFDAGIALARSAKDNNLRYLKQVKVRTGEFKYSSDNVLILESDNDGGYLRFEIVGTGIEEDHLNSLDGESSVDEDIIKILKMKNGGMTVRAIGDALNLSKSKVDRLIQRAKMSNITVPEDCSLTSSSRTVPSGTTGQFATAGQFS